MPNLDIASQFDVVAGVHTGSYTVTATNADTLIADEPTEDDNDNLLLITCSPDSAGAIIAFDGDASDDGYPLWPGGEMAYSGRQRVSCARMGSTNVTLYVARLAVRR